METGGMTDLDIGGSPLGAWASHAAPGMSGMPASRFAWHYLLPDQPMIRRVDTIDVHTPQYWVVSMEIDFRIPPTPPGSAPPRGGRCLVPVAAFAKYPVAPDLEVRNGAGDVLSVPTKATNMDLTVRALEGVAAEAAIVLGRPASDFRLSSELLNLAADVIHGQPRHARVCRQKIERDMECPALEWLVPLLRRLEDHFLLWVPVPDDPGADLHLSVCRSERRWLAPLLRPFRREVPIDVESSAGVIPASWHAPFKLLRWPDPAAFVGRLLIACGLMPVTINDEGLEAHRFSSYHRCFAPPAGFILREIRMGKVREEDWEKPRPDVHRLEDDVDRTVQGEDTKLGHVHLAEARNPSRIFTRATIGLRPETITLWALVAVLTCGLLWAFHRNIAYIAALSEPAKIAVGVLLIGPTFASAWTLREKDRALMRSVLAGTRLLMLASAALSVATVLAVAGLLPFGWDVGPAVSWYASASFTIAAFVVTGWLQARNVVWSVFRHVLTKTKWNLLATILLALASYVAIAEIGSFPLPATALLFATGFAFTAVAANRSSIPLGGENHLSGPWGALTHLPAALAGLAAIVTLAIASRELTFYNHVADRGEVHEWGLVAELAIAAAAVVLLIVRYCFRLRDRKRSGAGRKNPLASPERAVT